MTLPVQAVRAERRSIGLGIYFTCYYIGMALAPPIAGTMRDIFSSATAPMWTAVVALVLAVVVLAIYRFIQGTVQVEQSESH
jgi:MFS family permease